MMIDTLEQAANAAGYAMAAPDDEPEQLYAPLPDAQSRALVLSKGAGQTSDALNAATEWFRTHLPFALGGRAPA